MPVPYPLRAPCLWLLLIHLPFLAGFPGVPWVAQSHPELEWKPQGRTAFLWRWALAQEPEHRAGRHPHGVEPGLLQGAGVWIPQRPVHMGPDPQIFRCACSGHSHAALPSGFSPAFDFLVPTLTSVSPSPKVGQLDEVSGFPTLFPKEPFLTHPTGKHKRAAAPAETGRAGPTWFGCTTMACSPEEVHEPWGGYGVSALPPHCPPRQGFPSSGPRPSFWGGFRLGISLSLFFLPLFLFGKFDQVASEKAALGLKSKPELRAPGAPAWFPW